MTNHKTKELSFSSTIILVYQYPAWIRAKLLEQLKRNIIPPKIIWAKVYQEIQTFSLIIKKEIITTQLLSYNLVPLTCARYLHWCHLSIANNFSQTQTQLWRVPAHH